MRRQIKLMIGALVLLMGLSGSWALADRPARGGGDRSAGQSQRWGTFDRFSSPDADRPSLHQQRYHSPAPSRTSRDHLSDRHDLRREMFHQRQQRAADPGVSDRLEARQRQAELRLRQRQEIARQRAQGRRYLHRYDRYDWYHHDRYRYRHDGHHRLDDRYRTGYWGTIRPYHDRYRQPIPYRPLDLYYGGRRYRIGDTWYYTPPYVLHPRYYSRGSLLDGPYRYPYWQHGHRYHLPRWGFYIDLRF